MSSSYTFSKHFEEWGWSDLQKGIKQRRLYWTDRPHRFTAGMVYDLPFGKGKQLFNTHNRVISKIISGWQSNLILQWQSGRPWSQPTNLFWMNEDAILKDIDWKADRVHYFRTYADPNNPTRRAACVGYVDDAGKNQLMGYSKGLSGCTVNNIDFLKKPRYAPSTATSRHPRIRSYARPMADLSFAKNTSIRENMNLQFRVEMFNVTNTYNYGDLNFGNDLDRSEFGSVVPRLAPDWGVAYPRQIQLGMKLIW